MATTNGNNHAKAYSYLRFSTPEQGRGDSFRRQAEAAQRFAEQQGLDLDDDLRFEDRGVSGFKGRNVHEGALGRFINAVDTGRVRPGSYLLVESLDRLSRDRIGPALDLFRSILAKDVNIVTLSDGKVYTKDSADNLMDLMFSLMIMARAHEESAMKSKRVKAAWKSKRDRAAAEGAAMTSITPNWLRLNKETREYEVIEDRAKIVRRIYTMYLDGYGKGKTFSNLLSGLATCGMCGASMQQMNKGRPPKGNRYLRCYSARRKANGCSASAVRYEVPLLALLNSLTSNDLDFRRILGTADDATDGNRLRTLREQIESIEGRLTEMDDAIDNLMATAPLAKTDRARETLAARMDELGTQQEELQQEKERLEDELRDATHSTASRDDMVADVTRLVSEWSAMLEQSDTDPAVLYDVNLRLNAGLKQIIESIAIARHEGSREWIEGELLPFVERTKGDPLPTEVHRATFQSIVEGAGGSGVSMAVNFRNTEDRLLIIYAEPRAPRRYLAAALWLDGDGAVRDVELTVSTG